MNATLLAPVLALCLQASYFGPQTARDELLVTPAPYPANRVDSPARAENGRLWMSRTPVGNRTPIREQVFGDHGPAAYGAPWHEADRLIFVRIGHTPIAISPWRNYSKPGFERFERARQQWLREHGYIESVRTHVNPRFRHLHTGEEPERMMYPTPRATIHIDDELPRRPSRMRVEGPVSGEPITRISRPHAAPDSGPIRAAVDDTDTTDTVAEAADHE